MSAAHPLKPIERHFSLVIALSAAEEIAYVHLLVALKACNGKAYTNGWNCPNACRLPHQNSACFRVFPWLICDLILSAFICVHLRFRFSSSP